MNNIMIIFNTTILIALGLGVLLSQIAGDKLLSGWIFIAFGFIYYLGSLFIDKFALSNENEVKECQ